MKKILTLIYTLLCANVLLAQVGTTFWNGDLQYEVISTNPAKVEVNDANTDIATANIPTTVSYEGTDYSVTSIGNDAFSLCSSLTSVTIPDSVTSIGDLAFNSCSSLTSVTIPNSVTSIGWGAFNSCSSLTSIDIPNSVTSIGEWAFYGCSSLTSVTIPNSVTSIGSWAFGNCSRLTSVTCLAETAPSLGSSVFYSTPSTKTLNVLCESDYSAWESATTWASVECIDVDLGNDLTYFPLTFAIISEEERTMKVSDCETSATDVEIPARVIYNGALYDVISIGNDAFWGCSSLTSVTIPNSVTSIGNSAFRLCDGLTSVTIPNGVTSIGESAFEDCSSLTSIDIPNSVTSIGDYAFSLCSSLTSVTIPNSVTSIGNSAFYNCSSLTSITIPNSVTSIGDWAFAYCSSLTSITIPNSVTSIGRSAFRGCSSLTSITIPNSVTSIVYGTFSSCSSLTSIDIPNSVTSIGDYAFSNCSSLTSVTIPNSVTSIVYGTFSSCSSLTSIDIPNSVTSIGSCAFSLCSSLTAVTIPNSVTSIGNSAFYNCSSLTSVTIPNSVTSIGNSAFYNCSSLTSVTIPNSVTSIGSCAFSLCSSLTAVTIPNSVTSIGSWAFEYCSSLTSVTCLKETAPSLGVDVFSSTPSTKVLNIPCGSDYSSWESATDWASVERIGCEEEECVDVFTIGDLTYEKTSATTVSVKDCSETATEVIIPASVEQCGITYSVTSIGEYAFEDCSSLTSIDIPNGVTSIGTWAFAYCSSLTSIDIPNSVTSIESATFKGCSSLTSVDIPNGVTSIGDYAFVHCYNLTSVTIPSSVTSIGGSAFSGCSSLETISIPNGVTAIGSWAFSDCSSLISIDIPNGVTSIGDFAFYVCRSLTSIDIPNSVTSIGNYTFCDCSSLTSIDIPNGVTSIGDYAFGYCSNLTSVTIPNSVTSIGGYAFEYCSSLTSVTCLAETAPSLGNNVFYSTPSNKTLTIPFNASYTSDWGDGAWQKIYHKINEGEIKTLTNAFEITEDNKRGVINEGVLRITQSGQLINKTETNVGGIIEIETPTLANDKWSFIGAPFNNYKLEAVKPGTKDISILLFDYETGNWSNDFATIEDEVGAGEGFFAWSFAAEPTVFTTYGDGAETYNFENTPEYALNNGRVDVEKNLTTHAEGGNWLALSNPYTFKLDVEKFLSEHGDIISEHGDIKGGVVYRFNGSVWTPVSEGEINMTEGFFVNFENPGTHSVSFSKLYIYEPAKSKAIEAKDYITLNVAEGENVSKLRFAQNDKAKQGDDIFDANKLFSPLEITEPYFVTDGVALVKEEVKEYPYTATLNIRNYETKEVTISIDNIPEGVNVFLLDNGQDTKMNGGVEYTTTITEGENADRFKVLFKKQHRLERIKDNQISITNNNRQISVKSDISDLNIEVYNQLGQKVFSTNEYNFTLSTQPAGSYVIKAYQGRYSKSKKIVIE